MPLNGSPILGHWLLKLESLPNTQIYINTHHFSSLVEKYLKNKRGQQDIISLYEKVLLGTAATISHNYKIFKGLPLLLIHSDNWSVVNLSKFINFHSTDRPKDALITMMTFNTNQPESSGIVELNSKKIVTNFFEKVDNPPSNLANAAVYMIEPEVVEWIFQNKVVDFSTEVIPQFLGKIVTWHNSNVHIDIGNIENLKLAQEDSIKYRCNHRDKDWYYQFKKEKIFNLLKHIYES